MVATNSEQRLELSRAVSRLSQAVLRGDRVDAILQHMVETVGPALDTDRVLVFEIRRPTDVMVGRCEWLHPGRPLASVKGDYSLCGIRRMADEFFATGRPLESRDTEVHPLLARDGADTLLHGSMENRRFLWYPFRIRPDDCYALFVNQVSEDRPWTIDEMEFLEAAVSLVELAVTKMELLEERERTEGLLRRSEAGFRLIYDQTPSMFFTVDREMAVRSVNRFALEHLGFDAADLIGSSVLRVVHPDDREIVLRHVEGCFRDPGAVRAITFRKVRRDRRVIWVRELIRVTEGTNGATAFIVCEDVTEARAHQEAARRAELKADGRDEFMAMLSHELRNPLSPIVTALEILRESGQTSREIEVIDRQVKHLRRLVDDLLDVSRITPGGKLDLHRRRFEFSTVAAAAAEIARPLFRQKGQTLHIAVPATGLEVYADSARLIQAFANILNNASTYSAEGQEVRFRAERQGDQLVAGVRDAGEGIEPEMLERIFDVFIQRPQPADRVQSGLGLGLTIARNLITLHDGTVHAESEGRGKGTHVVVKLPVAADTDTGTGPAMTAPEPRTRRIERDGDILVVDDNQDARESLSRLLRLQGYRVTTASDGPAALTIAREIEPRVVLLDIGLPGMDGYEVARRLRSARPSGFRLVAITGYGQPSDRVEARAAGFDVHLVKPVSLDALRPLLEELASGEGNPEQWPPVPS